TDEIQIAGGGRARLAGKDFSSRSSRLRGESWAGLSPRRREAREESAKDFSLLAALLHCVHLWFRAFSCCGSAAPSPRRGCFPGYGTRIMRSLLIARTGQTE